ncbi:MAG: hypothetical protein EU547_03860 [Promethearchaeota archaeon]|nr:MAG: hypothetical protein EU547_03860 [Candidatus Lokiarchaeota archaeon]
MRGAKSIKKEVISLIKERSEDVNLEDIMYHLYVKQKLLKAKEDIAQTKTYSHDEVKKMAKKWLR